jgi:hypothetical protein
MTKDEPPAPPPTTLVKSALLNFLAQGQDALTHAADPQIETIRLCQLEYAPSSTYHHVITERADDLFRCTSDDPPHTSPLPQDAEIIAATIEFRIAGSPDPAILEIRPPHSATLRPNTHAKVILAWLAKSCLNACLAFISGTLTILLSLALVTAPCLCDNDGDADDADGSSERLVLMHR